MIRNYLNVAWRNFRRGQLYSFINVAGLSIGLTSSILIFLYVSNELSYDRFYSKAKRIYRVMEFFEGENGSGERSSSIPFPMGEMLFNDYNNLIDDYVRFYDFQSPLLTIAYEREEKVFNERNFFFVDSSFLKIFDLELISGDPLSALNNSHAVMISESTAKKYFQDEAALGKELLLQNQTLLLVTGVFKDMPDNSHFRADFLASFSTIKEFYEGQYPQNWHWNPCWTYLLLKENANPNDLIAKFPEFVKKHLPESFKADVTLGLQRMTDIHLNSNLEFEIEPNGSEEDIYLFSGVALFVLLIASINFMNLSTARSTKRAKEVGMRKVVGSQRHQLVFQFMMESLLITFLAVSLSIVLVFFSLPFFNNFVERNLTFDLSDPVLIISLMTIGLIVGIISGLYPALVLTSFNAVKTLKANREQGKGLGLRRALVVFQFAISIALIIGTGVAIKQLNFLRGSSLGFSQEHVIMIPVIRTDIEQHYKTFIDEALQFPGIESITAVEEVIGAKHQSGSFLFEGMDRARNFPRLKVRHDFLKTFAIPLLAGRDYNIDNPTDDSLAVVVNERLVKTFNWTPTEALGRRCEIGGYQAKIIGVTRDFNFMSKHQPIGPLVIQMNNSKNAFNLSLKYMAVRVNPASVQKAIAKIKKSWKEYLPGRPFDYFFLSSELNNLYKSESNLIKVSLAFSFLAIFVACLGLFGLASFNSEQRKREIGIRKVLGSSTQQIVMLILSDYTRLLIVAVLVACPVTALAMNYWLSNFAYSINLPLEIFVLASLIVFAFAYLTVSYKSFSVASSNPVDSLRSE